MIAVSVSPPLEGFTDNFAEFIHKLLQVEHVHPSTSSTYSNLYNHPTRITEPVDTIKKQIKLSRKTGIPLGVVPGPERKTEEQTNNKGA